MKAQVEIPGRLMIFLAALALAGLAAFMVTSAFFSLPSLAFFSQIMIISGFWLVGGIVFYFVISWAADHFSAARNLFPARLTFHQISVRILLTMLFLFPFGLLAYQHLREFFRIVVNGQVYDPTGWMAPLSGAGPYTLKSLAIVLLVVFALFAVDGQMGMRKYLEGLPDRYYILVILLAALFIRLFFISTINSQPFSDFQIINSDAIRLSQGEMPRLMYVSTHVVTTLIYGFLYTVFGPQLIVIKLFHAFLYALSGIFIFLAGKEIFGSRFWAGFSGILMVTWPSLAFYSNVFTPEHLFIFVECVLVYVIARFFRQQTTNPHTTGWLLEIGEFIFIGFLIGLLGMFRPFSQLFLIAFLMILLIQARSLHQLKRIVVKAPLLLLIVWALGTIPGIIAGYYGNSFTNLRPCNLLVGMNIEAAGRFNVEDKVLCEMSELTSSNQNEFTQKMLEIVLERLYVQQDQLFSFIGQKFEVLWTNSNQIMFWGIQIPKEDDKVAALAILRNANLIDFSMMFVATLACLIGTALAFFKDVKPVVLFVLIAFLGFNLMEVFFEVQTRYRTVAMPLYIFFAGWAIASLAPHLQKIYRGLGAKISSYNAMRQHRENHHLPVLDGLRFLAFMMVFFYHAPLLGNFPVWQWLHSYGWMGVDLFLCISAYIVARSLHEEFQRTGLVNIPKFYIHRILYIWPLYYFFLICMFMLTSIVLPERIDFWRAVGLFTFTDNFFVAAVQSYNLILFAGHLWMISFEEQVHAVAPWALRLLFKMSPRAKTWTILIVVLIGYIIRLFLMSGLKSPHIVTWVLPFTHFESILFGLLIGLGSLDAILERVPPLVTGLLGLLVLAAVDVLSGMPFITYFLSGLGMALILRTLLCVGHRVEWLWFSSRPMAYLGRISYGLYVYHLLSLGLTRQYLRVDQANYWLWVVALFILPLLSTIAAASLSHASIEKPLLRLRERISLDRSRH